MSGGVLSSWKWRLIDRLYLPHASDARILIVAIDDASLARLGRWPWDRSVHAELIRKISAGNPAAIGYDVNFPEASDERNDAALESALKDSGKVVLPVELDLTNEQNRTTYDPGRVLASISRLSTAALSTGFVNTPLDSDGIMRRLPLLAVSSDGSSIETFAVRVAEAGGVSVDAHRGTDAGTRLLVNYPDVPNKGFAFVSAADVMDGKASADAFAGKFVLVGATAPNLHDEQLTAVSHSAPMPGIQIQASILDTLLRQDYLREVPGLVTFLWLVLLGALIGLLLPLVRARYYIPIVLALWIASIVASLLLFGRGWIADIFWPTAVALVGFGAVVLERRIASERQKREIRSAFSRYVSSSVVDSILADPSKLKLGGDRRTMTVLFSDIRGFTTMSEGLNPETLVETLNTYLSRMTDVVFAHEGVLDKYIGDAVMAFWNAPFDQADHARRAVETALDMLKALEEMNAAKRFGERELHIGVGINTGDMVVGNMGSLKRFDYTVIGDAVNLASRLESLTKEYGVRLLVSESTMAGLGDGYLARPVDLVAVKGKKEAVRVFEIVKRAAEATEEERGRMERFTRALEAYFRRDFAAAVTIANEILVAQPEDGPSKALKDRAEYFISDPPPADWNGAWVMKKK